jgi:3-isopropylmalate dehydrogenase
MELIMAKFKICCLPGDGIGPEILDQAQRVLRRLGELSGHEFQVEDWPMGGQAIDACGQPLPKDTLDACQQSDAVLLGAVGGPSWDGLEASRRPEKGLLALRKALNLYANLRPASILPELRQASCLRPDIVDQGFELMVIRELTGGIYFGEPRGRERREGGELAFNTMAYQDFEVERIVRLAFTTAQKRRQRLCSVDKANILEVSQLWREVVTKVAKDFPEVELTHLYVDNAAMQLVRDPKQFDVLVTSNLFGDILSDEAAMLTGSIGLLPSASLGAASPGLFEPIHGSAPDIAGQDKANPLAAILSLGMLLDFGLGLKAEARAVENAVRSVIRDGLRTADIAVFEQQAVGCRAMGQAVAQALGRN